MSQKNSCRMDVDAVVTEVASAVGLCCLHIWGYRSHATRDNSTNLWWVALLTYGEGWHNNHHAFATSARHGLRWWEIDMTYWTICAMEKLGLAWNVVHSVPSYQKPQ